MFTTRSFRMKLNGKGFTYIVSNEGTGEVVLSGGTIGRRNDDGSLPTKAKVFRSRSSAANAASKLNRERQRAFPSAA